ncbi:MAG: hypothetical protein AB9M60_21910 [Leptothrix sp. (in: b-proteobacteria)]
MSPNEHHTLHIELIAERQTVRYHCAICERCVEDGPDGLRVLVRGDPLASHSGGSFEMHAEVEQPSAPPPMLH